MMLSDSRSLSVDFEGRNSPKLQGAYYFPAHSRKIQSAQDLHGWHTLTVGTAVYPLGRQFRCDHGYNVVWTARVPALRSSTVLSVPFRMAWSGSRVTGSRATMRHSVAMGHHAQRQEFQGWLASATDCMPFLALVSRDIQACLPCELRQKQTHVQARNIACRFGQAICHTDRAVPVADDSHLEQLVRPSAYAGTLRYRGACIPQPVLTGHR